MSDKSLAIYKNLMSYDYSSMITSDLIDEFEKNHQFFKSFKTKDLSSSFEIKEKIYFHTKAYDTPSRSGLDYFWYYLTMFEPNISRTIVSKHDLDSLSKSEMIDKIAKALKIDQNDPRMSGLTLVVTGALDYIRRTFFEKIKPGEYKIEILPDLASILSLGDFIVDAASCFRRSGQNEHHKIYIGKLKNSFVCLIKNKSNQIVARFWGRVFNKSRILLTNFYTYGTNAGTARYLAKIFFEQLFKKKYMCSWAHQEKGTYSNIFMNGDAVYLFPLSKGTTDGFYREN